MKAELKRLHSPDIYDLAGFKPENPNIFHFLLQAMVGPKGIDGEESFDIEICTPSWIEHHFSSKDFLIGRHYLIVQEYNYQDILLFISDYVNKCEGDDWNEIASKISRLGKWEFEDYKDE